MALNKEQLEVRIIDLLTDLKDEENQPQAIQKYAEKLSSAIDEFVRTGQVIGVDSQSGPINGEII